MERPTLPSRSVAPMTATEAGENKQASGERSLIRASADSSTLSEGIPMLKNHATYQTGMRAASQRPVACVTASPFCPERPYDTGGENHENRHRKNGSAIPEHPICYGFLPSRRPS